MWLSTSSGVRFPVNSSNADRARSRSASTNSSAARCSAASAAAPRDNAASSSSLMCRMLATIGVSLDPVSPTSTFRRSSRSRPIPCPVRAETSTHFGSLSIDNEAGDQIPGRSTLFTTTTRGDPDVSSNTCRSSAASARDRSTTTRHAVATPNACRARDTPSASTGSPVTRMPAESIRLTASPSRSIVSDTRSRVVPGTGVTMAREEPSN